MKEGDREDRIGGAFFSVGVVIPSTLENVVYMSIMTVDEHWRKEQGQDRIDGTFFQFRGSSPLHAGKCVVYMTMMVDGG